MDLKEFLTLFKTLTYNDHLCSLEDFFNIDSGYFEMNMLEVMNDFSTLDTNKKFVGYCRFGFDSYSENEIIEMFKEYDSNISEEDIVSLLNSI